MKVPKSTKRYCPTCKTHTEQKISLVSSGHKRGSLRRGGKVRMKMRGLGVGKGNHGKYSRKPVGQFKKKTKTTKKTNFLYTCKTCNKSTVQNKGVRTGKLVFEEKEK